MQKLYSDTRIQDSRIREEYLLTEDIMMENAAASLEAKVLEHAFNDCGHYLARPVVLVLCGSGNNGGDGYALARRLAGKKICAAVCSFGEPKTEISAMQKQRAQKLGVTFLDPMELDNFIEEKSFDLRVVVDCIFGAGFHGELPIDVQAVLEEVNALNDVYRIACDIPSGFAFRAHHTVTMGALKECLYQDFAKDYCGVISVADLGVTRTNFENAGTRTAWLLEQGDMELPTRTRLNVNKGSFGHVAVCSGEKAGASVLAGSAALAFGAGLVTVVSKNNICGIPWDLMNSQEFPENVSAVAIGMGMGNEAECIWKNFLLLTEKKPDVSVVLDADILCRSEVAKFLELRKGNRVSTVVTPHPKEFASLLEVCGLGKYSVQEIQNNRMDLARSFCKKYPEVVLVLKGACEIIAVSHDGSSVELYVNPLGTPALSKAGSGDVLAGMIASLLAQRQVAVQGAVNASLAHAIAAGGIKNNFSLTATELIARIGEL